MNFIFHPEAEGELNAAIDFYEQHQKGLGYDFSLEVHATVDRIIKFPAAWPKMDDEIRRALVYRFPFGVLYHHLKKQNLLYIVAIMHLKKEPGYWNNRI